MTKNSKATNGHESQEPSRREFLKTAGRIAIYTPPAVMMLLHPSRKALASGTHGDDDDQGDDNDDQGQDNNSQ